jgi:hypothetical protein
MLHRTRFFLLGSDSSALVAELSQSCCMKRHFIYLYPRACSGNAFQTPPISEILRLKMSRSLTKWIRSSRTSPSMACSSVWLYCHMLLFSTRNASCPNRMAGLQDSLYTPAMKVIEHPESDGVPPHISRPSSFFSGCKGSPS